MHCVQSMNTMTPKNSSSKDESKAKKIVPSRNMVNRLPAFTLLVSSSIFFVGLASILHIMVFTPKGPSNWMKHARKTGARGEDIWRLVDSHFDVAVEITSGYYLDWQKQLKEGGIENESKEEPKSFLLYFDSDLEECTECRRIDAEFDLLADELAEKKRSAQSEDGKHKKNKRANPPNVQLVKIDALINKVTSMRFGIRGLPSIVFLPGNELFYRYDMTLLPTAADLEKYVLDEGYLTKQSAQTLASGPAAEEIKGAPNFFEVFMMRMSIPESRNKFLVWSFLILSVVFQFWNWWQEEAKRMREDEADVPSVAKSNAIKNQKGKKDD